MSLEIIESDETLEDVITIADYIAANSSLDASDRFLGAVKEAYRLLATMPNVGAKRDYGNPALVGMRMWPVPRFRKYLIFYLATEDQLKILRVVHGARNLQEIFAPKKEE